MTARIFLLALIAASLAGLAPASAAERSYSVTDFERIRIVGAYEVKLTTGKFSSARATGDDRALDSLMLTVEGRTLIVRARPLAVGESRPSSKTPLVITLTTINLRSANINGAGRLTISRMAGTRVDLSVNGPGVLDAKGLEAEELIASVIGAGTMTLAGHSGRARFLLSGSGMVDAGALVVDALTARSEGSGDLRLSARYTASVTSSGLGSITVLGKPECKTQAAGGGIISCGSQ